MLVRDVMTVDPVTIDRETTIRDAAATMFARRISLLPVCDGSMLVGVISRSHLLRSKENPLQRVGDIMDTEPTLVGEWMTVTQATRLMHGEGAKAAPVVRDGQIVGVITETDLLRPYLRTDDEIRVDVEESFNAVGLGLSARDVPISIVEGAVTIGPLPDGVGTDLLRRLIEGIDGVTGVRMQEPISR